MSQESAALSCAMLMNQDSRLNTSSSELLVFVYGRMKRGGAAHAYLASARDLGPVMTAASYELVDLGGFPGLIAEGGTAVHGELYAIDRPTLANLDELEDHPDTFHRDILLLEDGREVIGYVLPLSQALGFPRVESGVWDAALAG